MSDLELTNREYAVLRGLAAGMTQESIARRLNMSTASVFRAQKALAARLAAGSPAQLVDRAWRLGVLTAATPLLTVEQPLPVVRRVIDPPALIRQRRHDLNEACAGYDRHKATRTGANA